MPTLPEYRRALARKLGSLQIITTGAQASPPTGSYVGVANGSQAQREVISSDLASQVASGTSRGLPASRFNEMWAYALTTNPEQRRITIDSYASNSTATDVMTAGGTVVVGKMTVDRNWNAALPASTTVEIHSECPVLDAFGQVGLHSWINKALQRIKIPDRLSISGVTDQYRYSLASYPWVDEQQQLIAVMGPVSDSDLEPFPLPGGGRIRTDANVPYLVIETPVATGQTFFIDIYRPSSSWIKVSGTWGESTVGLVNETDEAKPTVDLVANVAAYFYADARVMEDPPGSSDKWARIREQCARIAMPHFKNQEQETQARLEGLSFYVGTYGAAADSPAYRRNLNAQRGLRGRTGWP